MLPLSGIRLLAWTTAVAGPYGGMMFADLGAEVINIERPRGRVIGRSLCHDRHKKSIALNARTDDGKEILERLIKSADVLYENYAPGAIKRLGFPPEVVLKINPRIIYASCKGYGDGPYGMRPAWDPCIESESGYMSLTGYKKADAMPMRVGGATVDMTTAMFNVISVIGALIKREKTGKGEYIRGNMFEDAVSSLGAHIALYTLYGKVLGPLDSGEGAARAYQTADWWVYVDASSDENWAKFCNAIGIDQESTERYSTKEAREEDPKGVEMLMEEVLLKMTMSEIIEKLEGTGVPVAPINTMKEVIDDPHYKATGTLVRVLHDKKILNSSFDKAIIFTKLPVRTSDYNPNTEDWDKQPSPDVGEHTIELLQELGYTQEQITDLRKRKIVVPYLDEELERVLSGRRR